MRKRLATLLLCALLLTGCGSERVDPTPETTTTTQTTTTETTTTAQTTTRTTTTAAPETTTSTAATTTTAETTVTTTTPTTTSTSSTTPSTTQPPQTQPPQTQPPQTNPPQTQPPQTQAPQTQATSAQTTAQQQSSYSPEAVYNAMIAMKAKYPEGTPWTNDNYYDWKGGIFNRGYGCAGFAFILSDAAFGDLPARQFTDFAQLRVGDILRMNNNGHSVVILEIRGDQYVIAEGNYNNSIHWGRIVTKDEVFSSATTYAMTRYPQG